MAETTINQANQKQDVKENRETGPFDIVPVGCLVVAIVPGPVPMYGLGLDHFPFAPVNLGLIFMYK